MEMLSKSASHPPDAALARVLRDQRLGLAGAFAEAFDDVPRWAVLAAGCAAARADYLATHFVVFADYLTEYFAGSDDTFKSLFIGESVKSLYDADLDGEGRRRLAAQVLGSQRQRVQALLKDKLGNAAFMPVDGFLQDVQRALSAKPVRTQRVLLVGDCIFLDVMPFLVAELMSLGIGLVPEYLTSKNPAVLHDELSKSGKDRFDIVFFSPFTYEFSAAYAQLLQWRRALMPRSALGDLVDSAWADARRTIDLLNDLFDCPIHIHNASAVIREESTAKRVAKLAATTRIRAASRRRINDLLQAHAAARNGEALRHLFVLDEERVVAEVGEAAAGAYFYKSPLQHPARLGQLLAPDYVDRLYVNAWLARRKVVVCDLDQTLWDGVIGEGAVTHLHDRQSVLKALREKGVLLAINSKNDPANVHWRGATLGDADFVSAAISWEPKVDGMKRIQAALNLKAHDYVFVDDRTDELELMKSAYPDIVCLSADDPSTWRRLALWSRLLQDDPGGDRTLLYRQRAERKAFVDEVAPSCEERDAALLSLGLALTVSLARPEDLGRATELINRTNQFNLDGARTTLREMTGWHRSPDHVIVLGTARDRFGDMGTVCVAVAHFDERVMRLLPFVLSCRVFGYRIEHAVMSYLLDIGRERDVERAIGRHVETPLNSPCREFLATCGFARDGQVWSRTPHAPLPVRPPWLTITTR